MYDVLFIPNLKQNLFAVKVAAKKGIDFSITNNGKQCLFIRDKEIVATSSDIGNLYKINLRVLVQKDCNLIFRDIFVFMSLFFILTQN